MVPSEANSHALAAEHPEQASFNDQHLRVRLRRLVIGVLGTRMPAKPFSDEDVLAEVGVASIDMVTLLLAIEREFDFEVPQDEITADVFRSIATLDAMVRRRLPGAPPA